VVLLHGFAATARHWDAVIEALPAERFAAIALNLTDAEPVTPAGVTELIASATDAPFVLVGYSMGGRLALNAALELGERVERLVLISANAGIEDAGERAARRREDEALAAEIERGSIEQFVLRWRGVGLFANDPEWVKDQVAEDERRCTPALLAACLRGLGVGAIEPMWERLGTLAMPVAVVAGAEDAAYVMAAGRLAAAIPQASFRAVARVGHRVALQAPEAVVEAIAGAEG
jgi:2-succinyl-6-hydroxy-2,4-cyclohexadiene-1-carboxylate synthase